MRLPFSDKIASILKRREQPPVPDVCVLYASAADGLTPEEMEMLCGVKSTVSTLDGQITYLYTWPDLEVKINQMPQDQIAHHLKGFEGYVRSYIFKGQVPPYGEEVIARIRSVRLVLSIGITPGMDSAGRADTIISKLKIDLKPLVFYGADIYDYDDRLLLATDGSHEES